MFKEAYKTLPNHYEYLSGIDMKNNKKQFYLMNILSVILFVACFIGLMIIKSSFEIDLIRYGVFMGGCIVYIILHEIVHAIFFRIKNDVKVKFKFHGFAASASVPGVYYHKVHYLIISLAPFVLLSLVFIPSLFLISDYWFAILYLIFSMHVSGCSGDFYVFVKVLLMPKDVIIEDDGISMKIYHFVNEPQPSINEEN
jgi:Putative zincin peptidase